MDVRISHELPGRLRIVIAGMRNRAILACRLQSTLSQTRGIKYTHCNPDTGRALVYFDQSLIVPQKILTLVTSMMASADDSIPEETVAATLEHDLVSTTKTEENRDHGSANRYLLPTVASASLLGAISVKRLLLGRSVWATSPATFWMAAGVSIVAGYPTLRSGIESLIKQRKASPDLWMGLTTLSMAVVRENPVALSLITALNLAMYRRFSVNTAPENTQFSPELENHSQRMSRLSLWLGPLSFLLTRNPLRALGVVLASNPRPAIMAHKYRWAVAEREAHEKNLLTTSEHGLSSLALVKNIVFANEDLIHGEIQECRVVPLSERVEEGKIVALAASLTKQCAHHPWRETLMQRVNHEQRTIHKAFEVEHRPGGIRGVIQGHETLLGNRSYIQQNGINDTATVLEERRLRHQGFHVQILAVDRCPVAIFGFKQKIDPKWEQTIQEWKGNGYRVCTLGPARSPSVLEPITVAELMKALDSDITTVLIGDKEILDEHSSLIRVAVDMTDRLPETLQFCRDNSRYTQRDISVTKTWNIAGIAMALIAPVTAPLIALSGDVVSMYMIAAENWRHRMRKERRGTAVEPSSSSKRDQAEPFHAIGLTELLKVFEANTQGLNDHAVREHQATWGSNALTSPEPLSSAQIFLSQFKELSMLILLGTAGLSFVLGERFSALCMVGILVLNAVIATWQEKRSNEIIQALKVEDDLRTAVIREGHELTVPTKDLVPGDVVLLEPGDRVPADLRIIEAWSLEVNEAMLTGESAPVAKRASQLQADTPLTERTNSLFMGTVVTRGRCKALVVAIGNSTEIGQLQDLLNKHEDAPTFLQRRVTAISKRFVVGALVAAALVAVAGLIRGIPPVQLLISCVTLAASAIPEGLPLTITVALTAGVLQMSKRRTVVKRLANLESLGRVTVICSDKTGTLTKNEMTVQEITTIGHRIRVSGEGYVPTGGFYTVQEPERPLNVMDYADVKQLLAIGLLCNNASLKGQNGDPTGDPTEAALLTVAAKANVNADVWKRHREIPFDSAIRSMSVVCEENEQTNVVCEDQLHQTRCAIFTKGALEVVLDKCTLYQLGDKVHPMTEEIKHYIRAENFRMANKALRVLAFAYRYLTDEEQPLNVTDTNLIYVGLMGMVDPPKEGVAQSIEEARRLMIKPVMITGDHPVTAQAIGVELGIFRPGDRILNGKELDELSHDELDRLILDTSIFARVSPEHKLRIVEAFQRIGDVVAMTGDGVNDAPAMRQADVGIAMGLKGTDITKGTAGIVLMEDHFHAIVDGVKGGRGIIRNIRRAMGCLLSGNLAEVLVTAVSIMIGLPMPLIPLQILLMNILTDAVPAMVLATGPQGDTATTPYKDVIDKELYRTVITRGCVLGLGAVAVFAAALFTGVPLPIAQTMTYASLVVGQLMQTAAWRKYGAKKINLKRDRVLLLSTMGSALALAATIYVPGITTIFSTVPIRLSHWGAILGVTGGLTWISKWWLNRAGQKQWNFSRFEPGYRSAV